MDKLMKILLGNHQASSLTGVLFSALYALVGGKENLVTDPKILLVSAAVLVVGRFWGEAPTQEAQAPRPHAATAYVDAMTPTAPMAPPPNYVRGLEQQIARAEQQNRLLREHLAQNEISRTEVQRDENEGYDNLRHRPAPDRLRGEL